VNLFDEIIGWLVPKKTKGASYVTERSPGVWMVMLEDGWETDKRGKVTSHKSSKAAERALKKHRGF
jgi:hypothetical protein